MRRLVVGAPPVTGLRTGDQVRHDSYGVGTVVGLEGKGRSLTARVEFVSVRD